MKTMNRTLMAALLLAALSCNGGEDEWGLGEYPKGQVEAVQQAPQAPA